MKSSSPERPAAFSLVELLVSIAIIAALAALFFPASASLRRKAETTRCLSNLRSTGAAALRYFTDRGGYFFPTKYWEVYPSNQSPAVQGMRDYLGVESSLKSINNAPEYRYDSIITCPTMRRQNPEIRHALHRTYSYNYYLNYKHPHSKYNDMPFAQVPLLPSGYWKTQNVPSPSRMWMFTEAAPRSGGSYPTSLNETEVANNPLPFPHLKQQHFVFLDGHIEALSPEQVQERLDDPAFWGRRP